MIRSGKRTSESYRKIDQRTSREEQGEVALPRKFCTQSSTGRRRDWESP